MTLEYKMVDYRQMSMQERIDKLYKLISEWTYDLKTDDMTDKLDAWADGACIDEDAVTDELTEHVNVFAEMASVCEDMLSIMCYKKYGCE